MVVSDSFLSSMFIAIKNKEVSYMDIAVWLVCLKSIQEDGYVTVRQKEVCEALGPSQGSVSRAFKNLVSSGLLEKKSLGGYHYKIPRGAAGQVPCDLY